MYFPTWIDLKGQDAVPETVHHVVRLFMIRFLKSEICNCMTPLWSNKCLEVFLGGGGRGGVGIGKKFN